MSGLTLPHHLLAMDIIARGLSLLRGQRYDRILLLSPDHFGRGTTPFSVPVRDFLTCLGPAAIDRAGVERLLAMPRVSASNLFSHEHGVRAILPFIAHYFPKTPVLSISLRSSLRRRFVQKIRRVTAGAPLIINLEGVLAPQCPPPLSAAGAESLPPPQWRLCLPRDVTLALMRDINVIAAGLANNHSFDYGPAAYAYTKKILNENKITTLERNAIAEFKHFAVAALTDVDNSAPRKRLLLSADDLAYLRDAPRSKPLFAFIHWGLEGRPSSGRREKYLASLLLPSADLIIGHHPHRAGTLEAAADGIIAWSLGNFLFDQSAPQADGALLELNFFPQGTFWARQISLGNLYTSISSAHSVGPD